MRIDICKKGFNRMLALALAAGLVLTQPVAAMDSDASAESELTSVSDVSAESEPASATDISVEGDSAVSDIPAEKESVSDFPAVNDSTTASGISAVSDSASTSDIPAVSDSGSADLSAIKKPRTEYGVSTWDCIWFGNYWQGDTNGDGYCFEKDTVVSNNEEGTLVDQDGNRIYDDITEGKYEADARQPIKWRVLDIDDKGNALLLADKLIDIVEYNEKDTDVTWQTSTVRSYLNSYDDTYNDCKKDFSGSKGFINNAFTQNEINNIKTVTVKNPDNPVYGTEGADTEDKIFLLSIDEAMTAGYGFIKNEFTDGNYTDPDPTRQAVTTKFTDDKPGYVGSTAGTTDWWWLRSPGGISSLAANVYYGGAVRAGGSYVYDSDGCVRPAFRMNLSSSSSLWCYAGTVCSDGKVDEKPLLREISLPLRTKVMENGSVTLHPVEGPSGADLRMLSWDSSEPSVATVDENGKVTGHKAGVSTITVKAAYKGVSASCEVRVIGADELGIEKPLTEGEVSNWDCIWFGDYWQEDTNGDGHCFEKKTSVVKDMLFYYAVVNESGRVPLSDFFNASDWAEGQTEQTYEAEVKQPIKWRVLDIDEKGNAFLLADKSLDVAKYHNTKEAVTWETCSLRSYLNGTGTFSDSGFLNNAFSAEEQEAIFTTYVIDEKNPAYENVSGGNNTYDKVFCLSIREARTQEYGFVKNDFTGGITTKCWTDEDPTRLAIQTQYINDKPGFRGPRAGGTGIWWLRSTGYDYYSAAYVGTTGKAQANGGPMTTDNACVRPAIRMNLSSSSSLWSYAGTVCSNNSYSEGTMVSGVTLSSQVLIKSGNSIQLTPEIEPEDAFNRFVTWKSSDTSIATVSENGMVTGIKGGSAYVTVTTKDRSRTASCNVIVKQSVDGVKLTSPRDEIEPGESIDLTWEVLPSNAEDKSVSFISSAKDIASVDDSGRVTGIKDGSAVIIVTTNDGGYTASCNVLVKTHEDPPVPPTPTLKTEYNMIPGEVQRLRLNTEGRYTYGTRWTLSFNNAESKGCVSLKNGIVTAKNLKKSAKDGKAQATVTAECCGMTTVFKITVNGNLPSFDEDPDNKLKATKTVKAEVPAPEKGSDGKLRADAAPMTGDVGESVGAASGAAKKKAYSASVSIPKNYRSSEYNITGTVKALKERGNTFVESEGMKICTVGEAQYSNADRAKAAKATFEITPLDAGAAYIVWTVRKNGSTEKLTETVTKVLVKKPTTMLSLSQNADPGSVPDSDGVYTMSLAVGEGRRLIVTGTEGNTDPRDLSFKVKGMGIKVSKSGYVVATAPDIQGTTITVKSGKITDTIKLNVSADHKDAFIALNKTSANVKVPKAPKAGSKAKPKLGTVTLKPKMSVKSTAIPELEWTITDEDHKGISVDKNGVVSVDSNASPGCYEVKASPRDAGSSYNNVSCELIIK